MSHSYDITEENFSADVVAASNEVPVLVDFWATWCGPCKNLMPVLEKLAIEYAGKFRLAKIEIDQNPQLAQQFGVRSVPTVKLVINGQIVDEFTGAQPESIIRDFLDKHIPDESDMLMQQALTAYQQGDENAIKQMQDIINSNPDNTKLRIPYVQVLMNEHQYEDAKVILKHLPLNLQETEEVRAMMAQLEFAEVLANAEEMPVLLQRIEQSAKDSEARYQLSVHYMAQGDYESAMQQLLEIVRRDRAYNDDAGRKGLLRIFEMMGNQGELVSRFRRQLAQALN